MSVLSNFRSWIDALGILSKFLIYLCRYQGSSGLITSTVIYKGSLRWGRYIQFFKFYMCLWLLSCVYDLLIYIRSRYLLWCIFWFLLPLFFSHVAIRRIRWHLLQVIVLLRMWWQPHGDLILLILIISTQIFFIQFIRIKTMNSEFSWLYWLCTFKRGRQIAIDFTFKHLARSLHLRDKTNRLYTLRIIAGVINRA